MSSIRIDISTSSNPRQSHETIYWINLVTVLVGIARMRLPLRG